MSILTREHISAMKNADYFVIWYNKGGKIEANCVKEHKSSKGSNPFEGELRFTVPCTINVWNDRITSCVTSIRYYHEEVFVSVLELLRAGDEIEFTFYPNAMGNELTKAANLYGDCLYMIVKRKNKRLRFLIDVRINADNSARMCK